MKVGRMEFDAGAEGWQPLFEACRGKGVIGEEKVLDGVFLSAAAARGPGICPGGDALVVSGGEGVPVGAGQGHGSRGEERTRSEGR